MRGSFVSAFWWGGHHKCGAYRGGFWLHRRRRSHLCSVRWCGWICVCGVVGKSGALYLSCGRRCLSCLRLCLWIFSHTAGEWRKEAPVTVNRGRRWGLWCPARHGEVIGGGQFASCGSLYLETVHALAFLHPATSGYEGVRFVSSVWGSSCFACDLGGVSGSSISVGMCDHLGLSPFTPLFLSACRGEEWCASFVSLLGGLWTREAAARRFVVCGGRVL